MTFHLNFCNPLLPLTSHYRLSVEAELTELLDLNQRQLAAMEAQSDPEDIYCSVPELRDRDKARVKVPVLPSRDALQEISLNKVSSYMNTVHLLGNKMCSYRQTSLIVINKLMLQYFNF